jgi:phage gp45-like
MSTSVTPEYLQNLQDQIAALSNKIDEAVKAINTHINGALLVSVKAINTNTNTALVASVDSVNTHTNNSNFEHNNKNPTAGADGAGEMTI